VSIIVTDSVDEHDSGDKLIDLLESCSEGRQAQKLQIDIRYDSVLIEIFPRTKLDSSIVKEDDSLASLSFSPASTGEYHRLMCRIFARSLWKNVTILNVRRRRRRVPLPPSLLDLCLPSFPSLNTIYLDIEREVAINFGSALVRLLVSQPINVPPLHAIHVLPEEIDEAHEPSDPLDQAQWQEMLDVLVALFESYHSLLGSPFPSFSL
jgi:hypothetical protein